jgi:hypothetical protein
MVLAISNDVVKRPDTVRDEVVRLQKIEVLFRYSATLLSWEGTFHKTHIVVHANINVFATFLFLLDKAGGKTSAAGIDNGATLFPLHRRMETQILSTCQAEATEFFFVPKLLSTVLHERLQLD